MLATGQLIGDRYELRDLVARGGVADVYRAIDPASGEVVAVKILRDGVPDELDRFHIEARSLRRLDHPAIVRLCDEGEHDGRPYLVLDYVDGEPLSSVLARRAYFEDEVIALGRDVAGALAHAHGLGVVHRDVKPANVLVERGCHRLTDFGIARFDDGSATTTVNGRVLGTESYLSPEQRRGETVGAASDVYSLGLVLRDAGAADWPALAALVDAMTADDPARRPTARGVEERLRALSPTTAADQTRVIELGAEATGVMAVVSTSDGERRPAPWGWARAHWWIAAIGVAVLLLAYVVSSDIGDTGIAPLTPAPTPSTTAPPSTTTTAPPPPSTTAPPPTTTPPDTTPAPSPPPSGDGGKHHKK